MKLICQFLGAKALILVTRNDEPPAEVRQSPSRRASGIEYWCGFLRRGTDAGSLSWKLFQRRKYHLPPSLKPNSGENFARTSAKKKPKRLYPVDSIFFNLFRPFQNCYSYKETQKWYQPSIFPHCDKMYEKPKPTKWIFLVWRRRGGECAVMKQADRLYHMTSPVGTHLPNKTLHRNTPHKIDLQN